MTVILVLIALFLAVSLIYIVWYKRLKARASAKASSALSISPRAFPPAWLEEKRKHTDPLADRVVSTIMAKNELASVNHLFHIFINDSDRLPESAPAEIRDYFDQTSVLPSWADKDLIALGQQVYIRHGAWISLMLSYKSLPECYACAKGAEVLFRTARLNEEHGSRDTYARRIAETAQFVFYAMKPNGLGAGGHGMHATQKVRLIHAIIRYYLKQKNWDSNRYGEPINQQDMAGTLMSFSALVLEGLESIGISLENVEKEAYIHCWRVIGHIIGLDDDIIPSNSIEALSLGHAILDNQIAPSEHGQSLMKSLLEFQNQASKPIFSPAGNINMMRLMMGDKISDLLNVPPADPAGIKKLSGRIRTIALVAEWMDKSLVLAMVIQFFGKIMLQMTISKMTRSSVINFYLPESLTRDWGVKTSKK